MAVTGSSPNVVVACARTLVREDRGGAHTIWTEAEEVATERRCRGAGVRSPCGRGAFSKWRTASLGPAQLGLAGRPTATALSSQLPTLAAERTETTHGAAHWRFVNQPSRWNKLPVCCDAPWERPAWATLRRAGDGRTGATQHRPKMLSLLSWRAHALDIHGQPWGQPRGTQAPARSLESGEAR